MDILRGKDLYSTGSYGKDVGVGLMSALQNAFNKPNKYYVSANYMGNGLARTGIDSMRNPNYVNPYDYMNALTSSLYASENNNRQEDSGYSSNSLFNTLGKLSTVGGNIGNWATNQRGRLLPNGKLMFGNMFKNLGDFTNQNQRIIPISGDTIV